ncbi:hypothetical protein TOPH_08351 [Tolypocladium ophioglossoides CBS 100239]|uniref:Uncharacterized protein n=1 Tax=Tolypocladium ophioglossoides (strain CBS 100239) TaxID=1163406 RepID=A0A0L0MYV8_TOLOC|nr:hypothetical protein TOPH_08351 [Tolypocladium ophioglossoides CBS 100239]
MSSSRLRPTSSLRARFAGHRYLLGCSTDGRSNTIFCPASSRDVNRLNERSIKTLSVIGGHENSAFAR